MIKRLPTMAKLHGYVKAWFANRSTTFDDFGPINVFPVYDEANNTAEFFVCPEASPVALVRYAGRDRLNRPDHLTQMLKVPVKVPNYLMLCHVPGQLQWDVRDEIDPNSLRVVQLGLTSKVVGKPQDFFISTTAMSNSCFLRGTTDNGYHHLNMMVMCYGGFSVENSCHEKIGETLFAAFKEAGYEPMFKIALAGTYDRQRFTLILKGMPSGITALRHIETHEILYIDKMSRELRDLVKSVSDVYVGGVRMSQSLK